ncbi:MAG: FolB domain-containing protein [Alphaproteobacteria bacterium]|nr:FolB domain-containing protein [Alphaproteobacteria bacterium]
MGEVSKSRVIEPLRIADAIEQVRHVFIRDLVLPCDIGVHPHEKGTPQRVRINLDLAVTDDGNPLADQLENVVCYEDVVTRIRAITGDGHTNLVETLAERIAQTCLQHPDCHTVRVRIEKLDVFADVESVGVEIERKSGS